MALSPGARIGPYEVIAQIGVGGMGEVYRATDVTLGRDVAIKVLPDEFAQDAERLARFEREARTLASLSHPGIAILHGLERTDSTRAIIMEFVDGPTLADRIAAGAVPIDEAIAIVRQIADALEAAHDQGIVHRDLKPANIKIRDDGTVKVLDFGLAKTIEPAAAVTGRSMSPTITSPAMTQAGVILGTATYMSPEQAKGRAADKRSDVWALGCVFYELLTGKRAFDGEDISETLASILRSEPDWKALPRDVPSTIVALLRGLLEKDRRKRIADVAAVSFVLGQPAMLGAPPVVQRGKVAMWIAAALIGAIVGGGVSWWATRALRTVEPRPITRLSVPIPADQQPLSSADNGITLSPDGKYIAYNARGRLYLRPLDRLELISVQGTTSASRTLEATRQPQFSPDSRWLAFYRDGEIRKVPVSGGPPISIVAVPNLRRFVWEPSGSILFLSQRKIFRVTDAGATPVELASGIEGQTQSMEALPGGDRVLLTRFPEGATEPSQSEIVVRSLSTGHEQLVIRGGAQGLYVPTGHLLYFANASLLAAPFDERTSMITGPAEVVADKVFFGTAPTLPVGAVHVAISSTGTLAYVRGDQGAVVLRTLLWVDRAGHEELLGLPDDGYVLPRLSPDGRYVGVTMRGETRGDIWVLDLLKKTRRPFSTDPQDERSVAWMPDGKRLAFGSARGETAATWWQAADSSGTAQRLAGFPRAQIANFYPTSVSPKGDVLIVSASSPKTIGLWTVAVPGGEAKPLLDTPSTERNGELSPDGRWLAYEAVENGQTNVFVRRFPDVNDGVWPVTTRGGAQPVFSRNGKELFFLDGENILSSVSVESGVTPTFGTAERILPRAYVSQYSTYTGRMYDVASDGKRFLMMKEAGLAPGAEGQSITIVQNFFEELRRR